MTFCTNLFDKHKLNFTSYFRNGCQFSSKTVVINCYKKCQFISHRSWPDDMIDLAVIEFDIIQNRTQM